jgi:hypothetical protein
VLPDWARLPAQSGNPFGLPDWAGRLAQSGNTVPDRISVKYCFFIFQSSFEVILFIYF